MRSKKKISYCHDVNEEFFLLGTQHKALTSSPQNGLAILLGEMKIDQGVGTPLSGQSEWLVWP